MIDNVQSQGSTIAVTGLLTDAPNMVSGATGHHEQIPIRIVQKMYWENNDCRRLLAVILKFTPFGRQFFMRSYVLLGNYVVLQSELKNRKWKLLNGEDCLHKIILGSNGVAIRKRLQNSRVSSKLATKTLHYDFRTI